MSERGQSSWDFRSLRCAPPLLRDLGLTHTVTHTRKKRTGTMDGKVPETMHFCNKNVPKALNSSTPEVFNHLVRTERRAHAEMISSTIGEILLQKGGISL